MAPLMYQLVRLLIKVSANAFYAIEVEGLENIPPDGHPTILCPNHSNSLTDPVCLLSSISSKKRDLVCNQKKKKKSFFLKKFDQ